MQISSPPVTNLSLNSVVILWCAADDLAHGFWILNLVCCGSRGAWHIPLSRIITWYRLDGFVGQSRGLGPRAVITTTTATPPRNTHRNNLQSPEGQKPNEHLQSYSLAITLVTNAFSRTPRFRTATVDVSDLDRQDSHTLPLLCHCSARMHGALPLPLLLATKSRSSLGGGSSLGREEAVWHTFSCLLASRFSLALSQGLVVTLPCNVT